jgi:hypothetical protein
MFSLDHKQTGLVLDYCLGLCSPSKANGAEELIAHSDPAADLHTRVQTALAFLSYLPAEPCPRYLADLTIQRLCRLAEHGASAEGPRSRVIRIDPRERFKRAAAIAAFAASIVVCASVLIGPFRSPPSYSPGPVPTGQVAEDPIHGDPDDCPYARPTVWDEWQIIEPMPQVPGSYPGASGYAGFDPRRMDHFIGLGPRASPGSWGRHPGQPFQNHLARPSPAILSDQSR